MSRARRIVLIEDADYRALYEALKWTRSQTGIFECFVRPAARRDQVQNDRWWAVCRNLQYATAGQETAMYWHGHLASHVLGVDLQTSKGGVLVPVPYSTSNQEPVEFEMAIQAATSAAFDISPDFNLAPNEVAL